MDDILYKIYEFNKETSKFNYGLKFWDLRSSHELRELFL